jgi:membrane-bound lytic murein transglycosylase B
MLGPASRAINVLALLAAIGYCPPLAAESLRAQTPETRQSVDAQFRHWLVQTVWPDARKRGVSRETFDRAFVAMTLDWDLPEVQPPGARDAV